MNRDGIQFFRDLRFCQLQDPVFYLDPPYLLETRKQRRKLYRYEMTTADHKRLLDVIQDIGCPILISGYMSDLYAARLARWNHVSFQAMTRSGKPAQEHLWFNFTPPTRLHDYDFLGATFRNRETIKRQIRRWLKRLDRLPPLQRQMCIESIAAQAEIGPGFQLLPPR